MSPDDVQFYSMAEQQEDQGEWSNEQAGFQKQSPRKVSDITTPEKI